MNSLFRNFYLTRSLYRKSFSTISPPIQKPRIKYFAAIERVFVFTSIFTLCYYIAEVKLLSIELEQEVVELERQRDVLAGKAGETQSI